MENHSTPKNREPLHYLINRIDAGDTVLVPKLYTLADSTCHLAEQLEQIDSKGAFLHSLKEEIDTSHGSNYSFQNIVHCLVDFQSNVISEKKQGGFI